eukprot:scaffold47_cov258-Pinguiococcus_pyrenoidosus.AAC.68
MKRFATEGEGQTAHQNFEIGLHLYPRSRACARTHHFGLGDRGLCSQRVVGEGRRGSFPDPPWQSTERQSTGKRDTQGMSRQIAKHISLVGFSKFCASAAKRRGTLRLVPGIQVLEAVHQSGELRARALCRWGRSCESDVSRVDAVVGGPQGECRPHGRLRELSTVGGHGSRRLRRDREHRRVGDHRESDARKSPEHVMCVAFSF